MPLPLVPLPHPAGAERVESIHPLLRIGIASDVLGLYLCPGYLDVMRLYNAVARQRTEAARAELRSLKEQLQALRQPTPPNP